MKTVLTMLVISLCFAASAAKGAFVAYFVGFNVGAPGATYTISDPTYYVFTTTGWNSSTGQTAAWAGLRMSSSPGQPDSINAAFSAPNGQNLTVGLHENVVSYGTGKFDQYRMDISGGPIPLYMDATGWFNVLEIGFGTDGKVNKAAIDWNMSGNPGTLRYNSTIPLGVVPEPSTFAMFTLVGGLALIRRRK